MGSEQRKAAVDHRTAMKSFMSLMGSADKVMQSRYDREVALQVQESARIEFEHLVGEIPYVGGRRNPFSEMLVKAGVVLALYRALKKRGVSLEEYGEILEEITTAYMDSFSSWQRNLAGKLWMSRLFRGLMTRQAKVSQRRKYAGDFVYEVVSGSASYSWGINYQECGIVKFLHAQGEKELAKYACILDYLMFPAIGVDLVRTGNLAQGCAQCDFRFV